MKMTLLPSAKVVPHELISISATKRCLLFSPTPWRPYSTRLPIQPPCDSHRWADSAAKARTAGRHQLDNEISIHKRLSHPNVLQFFNLFERRARPLPMHAVVYPLVI
jgi:hypothetical protein